MSKSTVNNHVLQRAAAHSRAKSGAATPVTGTGCRCACHAGALVLICLPFLRPDGAAPIPTLTTSSEESGAT